LKTKH